MTGRTSPEVTTLVSALDPRRGFSWCEAADDEHAESLPREGARQGVNSSGAAPVEHLAGQVGQRRLRRWEKWVEHMARSFTGTEAKHSTRPRHERS